MQRFSSTSKLARLLQAVKKYILKKQKLPFLSSQEDCLKKDEEKYFLAFEMRSNFQPQNI